MNLRPLHDWMVVEIEPSKETFEGSSIFRVSEVPVRIGKVLAIGPGRMYPDKFVPTEVEVGERVVFLIAAADTQSGKAVHHHLPDNQRLIRETDVLFVTGEDIEVSK
jgi:co-chaperonin GroES (HSP10)